MYFWNFCPQFCSAWIDKENALLLGMGIDVPIKQRCQSYCGSGRLPYTHLILLFNYNCFTYVLIQTQPILVAQCSESHDQTPNKTIDLMVLFVLASQHSPNQASSLAVAFICSQGGTAKMRSLTLFCPEIGLNQQEHYFYGPGQEKVCEVILLQPQAFRGQLQIITK